MKQLRSTIAVVGALGLAGSLVLGPVAQVSAAVSPVTTLTNGNFGLFTDPFVDFSVAGCSVADGGAVIEAVLVDADSGSVAVGPVSITEPADPATGTIAYQTAGFYQLEVTCVDTDGTRVGEQTAHYVDATNGELAATATVAGEPVTIASVSTQTQAGAVIDSFSPDSTVQVRIAGPDGLPVVDTSVLADANGRASWTGVLTSAGAHTVTFIGDKAATSDPIDIHVELETVLELAAAPDPDPEPILAAPVVQIVNADDDEAIAASEVRAVITGCTAAEGVRQARVFLHSLAADGPIADLGSYPALDDGGVEVSGHTPLPGRYRVDVACYLSAPQPGQPADAFGSAAFVSTTGYLLVGPEQWVVGDPVELSSPTLVGASGTVDAFDVGSQVRLSVTGPDGTVHDLGSFTADANGKFLATGVVLPFTGAGIYTVVAAGTLDGLPVRLTTSYQQVSAPGEPSTPAQPPPGQPTNPPSADRPTGLPRTGSEGLGLVPIAALISIVVGAAAVRMRRP